MPEFLGRGERDRKTALQGCLAKNADKQVYLGLIVHNGETYEGDFPTIVSRATFEKVQEVLKNRAKPRHSKKRHYFPFCGLLTCGECGAAITAQWAHGNGGTYRFTVAPSGLARVRKVICARICSPNN
jgi:hypothetical protein